MIKLFFFEISDILTLILEPVLETHSRSANDIGCLI